MKITNLILLPMVVLAILSNSSNRVTADKASCIQDCVEIHTRAAKACCAVAPYNPAVFAGCMLFAGGSLTACLGLCGAIIGGS